MSLSLTFHQMEYKLKIKNSNKTQTNHKNSKTQSLYDGFLRLQSYYYIFIANTKYYKAMFNNLLK